MARWPKRGRLGRGPRPPALLGLLGKRTWIDQSYRGHMAYKSRQLGCVAVPQGQNVVFPLYHQGFPPAVVGAFMSQHHVANVNRIPTAR